jgi:hypothetical protein
MLYVMVGTANNADAAGICHEDHGSAIERRMPARAGFRTRVPTQKDLPHG